MMDLVDVSVTALQDVANSLNDYKLDLLQARVSTGYFSAVGECSAELGRTEEQLRDLENELASEQKELDRLYGELDYAKKDLADAEFRRSKLEGEIAQAEQSAGACEGAAYKAKKDMEFHAAAAANAQYQNDAAAHQAMYEAAAAEYEAAVSDAENFKAQAAAASDELAYTEGTISKLYKDIDWLQRESFDTQQKVDALTDRKYRLENKLSRMRDAFNKLESDIRYFQSEIDRYVSASDIVADRLLAATQHCIMYITEYEDTRLI